MTILHLNVITKEDLFSRPFLVKRIINAGYVGRDQQAVKQHIDELSQKEFVLFIDREDIFVEVGSDHTDRELERHSIIKSKQICQNVVLKNVWKYKEVHLIGMIFYSKAE